MLQTESSVYVSHENDRKPTWVITTTCQSIEQKAGYRNRAGYQTWYSKVGCGLLNLYLYYQAKYLPPFPATLLEAERKMCRNFHQDDGSLQFRDWCTKLFSKWLDEEKLLENPKLFFFLCDIKSEYESSSRISFSCSSFIQFAPTSSWDPQKKSPWHKILSWKLTFSALFQPQSNS